MPDRLTRIVLLAARIHFTSMMDQMARLRELVGRHACADRTDTAIEGLTLLRANVPSPLASGIFEPRVCIVLGGAKEVMIGGETFRYDPASYFVASVAVPASGCVAEASPASPYLAVSLPIDRVEAAALLERMPEHVVQPGRGFGTSRVTPVLLNALEQLLELLDTPGDIPILASTRYRELLYRLLQNDAGHLRQIAQGDSQLSRVHRAIGWIRENFDEPLRVDELAALAGMSRASFHRHFRNATTMSPIQYQKTLRLHEARKLILDLRSAQSSAYRVGYESPSQFSRDYARLFGLPPARDAARLRVSQPISVADA